MLVGTKPRSAPVSQGNPTWVHPRVELCIYHLTAATQLEEINLYLL